MIDPDTGVCEPVVLGENTKDVVPSRFPMGKLEGHIDLLEVDDWPSVFAPMTTMTVKDELLVSMVEFRDAETIQHTLSRSVVHLRMVEETGKDNNGVVTGFGRLVQKFQ